MHRALTAAVTDSNRAQSRPTHHEGATLSDTADKNDRQRVFLGLEQPPLISAAEWLAKQYHSESAIGQTLDLSDALVVLPTARSKQRLLQLLVDAAEKRSLILRPPHMMTIGALPEHLYVAERPLASELTQHIAWVRAIEQTPAEELKPLLGDQESIDSADFQSLASVVSKLHIRLANDIWSFNSVRRYVAEDKKGFLANEVSRWEALTGIQQRYYKLLAEENLWDKFGARNYAAAGLLRANEIRCSTDREIILVGCADLNRSTSEMVRQVVAGSSTEGKRSQVSALIAADESQTDQFNEYGSIVTDQWLNQSMPLNDSQIRIADRPTDQAFAVAWHLTELSASKEKQSIAADQITIGVPDESIAPLIERNLRSIGLRSRHLAGDPLGQTAPAKLLFAISDYVSDQRYESFASLVRHPDLFDWIAGQVDSDSWLHDLGRIPKYTTAKLASS